MSLKMALVCTPILLGMLIGCGGGSGANSTGGDSSEGTDSGSDPSDPQNEPDPNEPSEPANNAPNVEAVSTPGYLGEQFVVDASRSTDPDGDALSFSWSLEASPPGSAIFDLADPGSATLEFIPDVVGEYVVKVTADDSNGGMSSETVGVQVTHPVDMLSYQPIDIEYSKSLDRMILVSASPNQVHILNVEAMEESTVSLNLAPTSVSVSPDGSKAAIGHDGWVSYVDLTNSALLNVIPVSTDAIDVVLAGNGYIYVFPREDQWESIYSLNIDTQLQTSSEGYSIYAGTLAKLHPSGNHMYGANNGLSPSDLEKYSITGGTAEVLYDSPYHGDHEVCGDLWFSEDGLRVFTKCSNVFRTTEVQETDMTYNGSFEGIEGIEYASHSLERNEVAVIPGGWQVDDTETNTIRLYEYEFLGFNKLINIPKVIVGNNVFASSGRYVYYSADGSSIYSVFQIDAESGALNDYGIWKVIE